MASEEESDTGETGSDQPPPPPSFPDGRRPSSGTDIGFDESTSGSELEAPADGQARGSTLQRGSQGGEPGRGSTLQRGSQGGEPGRGSTLQRGSQGGEPGRGSTLQRGSQGGEPGRGSMSKRGSKGDELGSERRKSSKSRGRESTTTEGKPPRRQWESQRASTGIEHVDLEMPETKELLRRLKEAEDLESSSSSSGHAVSAKLASPKPGEHHRGIKALHRAVQDNEMPMRMAYEQLDELAANADRVKFAIEKNRSLLTLQVKKTNERVLRVAFMAWSLEVEYQKYKKLQLRRALTWSIRSLESRAFKGWSRAQKLGKKNRRFETSATNMLQRRKLSQTWLDLSNKKGSVAKYHKEKSLIWHDCSVRLS
ncbi:hypothetical protein M758_12G152500 [Ceratodon purpureus]|nr:hypothetical protein M758_12G152500 [Ceratodon purpureus]